MKLTDAEIDAWWDRHDNVVAWGRMWFWLMVLFFGISIYLMLTTDNLIAIWSFIGFEWVFFTANVICGRRHREMHEEIEGDEQ